MSTYCIDHSCGICADCDAYMEDVYERREHICLKEQGMKVDINKVIELVMKDAEKLRDYAGMDGRWDDGGAKEMREQVKFYLYGREGATPPEWQQYVNQAQAMIDPEYETYQRLKEKFKDQ